MFIDVPLAIRFSQAAPNKVQMEGTQEDGRKKDSNAVAMVEVEGSRYFVVDQDLRKGDRRGDGQLMAAFFTVDNGERLKKPRLLYDPTHGSIEQKPKVRKSEEVVDLLNVLAGDAAMSNDLDSVIRLEEGRLSSKKGKRKGKFFGINKRLGKANASTSGVLEQEGNKYPKVQNRKEAVDLLPVMSFDAAMSNDEDAVNRFEEERRGKANASTSVVLEQEEHQHQELEMIVPPRLPDKGIRCAVRKRTSRLLWLHEFFRVYEAARSKNKFPWVYAALLT